MHLWDTCSENPDLHQQSQLLAATLAADGSRRRRRWQRQRLRCASAKQLLSLPSPPAQLPPLLYQLLPVRASPNSATFPKICSRSRKLATFQAHSGKLCQADDTIFKSHARSCSWLPKKQKRAIGRSDKLQRERERKRQSRRERGELARERKRSKGKVRGRDRQAPRGETDGESVSERDRETESQRRGEGGRTGQIRFAGIAQITVKVTVQ